MSSWTTEAINKITKQTDYDGRYEEFKPIFVDFMPIVNELVFYPNPTDGIFLMEYDQRSPYPRIYDTTGNVVTSTENFTKLSNQLQINISSLKRGVYLVSYKGKHYKIFKN